jgi:ribonuclease D
MSIYLHKGDLPEDLIFEGSIAIDTEAMGLNPFRDRLCLVQIGTRQGEVHLVQLDNYYEAPNLKRVLSDPSLQKIFHYARFDVAILYQYLNVWCTPTYCTKIASKLARTYTDKHGLKDLCRELLGIEISKHQQSSDWGAETLTEAQMHYAANDVLHLHAVQDILNQMLLRENRMHLAEDCFSFIKLRCDLDLRGWTDVERDIFNH